MAAGKTTNVQFGHPVLSGKPNKTFLSFTSVSQLLLPAPTRVIVPEKEADLEKLAMDELRRLEHLSLVSKVCTELDNHYSMNDKDLAEFIIDLAEKNKTQEKFKKALLSNGAEFSDSFVENLLRIIQHMKPAGEEKKKDSAPAPKLAYLREQLPFLAMPDSKQEKPKEEVAADMLDMLESMAPSKAPVVEKRERSEEKERKKKRRSRSRSRDDRRRRSRSRSRDKKRRSRSRSRDRKRNRSRSRDRHGGRNDGKKQVETTEPVQFMIYPGRVQNITNFGCFVALEGFRKKVEGLVHISQLRREGRVNSVDEVVSRGDKVLVKVLSTGTKTSLSMKDVDQATGKDLNPGSNVARGTEFATGANRDPMGGMMMNPERPTDLNEILPARAGVVADDDDFVSKKKVTRMSSPEKWELLQMIKTGVIDKSELPDFDLDTGLLHKENDEEEDIEIELVEEEAPFLKGQGRMMNNLSPVRIVKNPDGSLAQAAMMQGALAKERRENKMIERQQADNEVDTSKGRSWADPMPKNAPALASDSQSGGPGKVRLSY